MKRIILGILLPALFSAAGLFFLLQAAGTRTFLSYFLAAVFIGMGIASAQLGWQGSDRE